MDETPNRPGSVLPPEVLADLQDAIDDTLRGIRDPEKVRKARERMDQVRDEVRQRVGVLDIAVDLIREGRDE